MLAGQSREELSPAVTAEEEEEEGVVGEEEEREVKKPS